MPQTVLHVEIPGLAPHAAGKVRDIFEVGDALLIVTTDRVSAFDVVMPNGIPDKGRVLTQISRHWFLNLRPFMPNHMVTTDTDAIVARMEREGVSVGPEVVGTLVGRSMLVMKATVYPVECVVRGYLAGSLWSEYQEAGGPAQAAVVHGIKLPAGLQESDKLPEPLFTPATKETDGHDINIGRDELVEIVGPTTASELERASLQLYSWAAERALARGIIIADTKFEFGSRDGQMLLVDEALTPDSSRFWDAAAYKPGKPQPSFDKQYLRDWLVASGWNKEPPAPTLPPDVVKRTAEKYREAYRRVTGHPLPEA